MFLLRFCSLAWAWTTADAARSTHIGAPDPNMPHTQDEDTKLRSYLSEGYANDLMTMKLVEPVDVTPVDAELIDDDLGIWNRCGTPNQDLELKSVDVDEKQNDPSKEPCTFEYSFSTNLDSVRSIWNEYYRPNGLYSQRKQHKEVWGTQDISTCRIWEKVQLVQFIVQFVYLNTIHVYGKFALGVKKYFGSIMIQMDRQVKGINMATTIAEMDRFLKSVLLMLVNEATGKSFSAIGPDTAEAEAADNEWLLWESSMDFTDLQSVRSIWDKYYGLGRFSEIKGGLYALDQENESTWIEALSDAGRTNFDQMEKIVHFVNNVTKRVSGAPPCSSSETHKDIMDQMDRQLRHKGTIDTIYQALIKQAHTRIFLQDLMS